MAQLYEELTTDFSLGAFTALAQTAYPKAAVASLLNARIEADGTVRRRPGSIRTHASQLEDAACYGATRFRTASGTEMMVEIFGTKAYKSTDKGANWTQIATGLRQDYYTFSTWTEGGVTYLLAANGDTTIKTYNGTTWTTMANAPSGVKYVAVFNNRVWAGGHNGPIVQASKVGVMGVWASPSGLTITVQTHSGNALRGMYQIGPHLLVFDRNSTSYIDGFGEQTLLVASGATGFSRSVGCAGFRTIAGVGDNGAAWLSERGIEYYVPGGQIQLVSGPIEDFFASIDWGQLYENPGRPSACYDEVNQNYHCALALDGLRNDRVVVLNLLQQNVEYQRRGQLAAAAIDRYVSPEGGDLYFTGGADGYLTTSGGGFQANATATGYMELVTTGGDWVTGDASGYLANVTNDALPATLCIAPATDSPGVVYWGGYDGWVRRAHGVDLDDMDSDGTGGSTVTMNIITRPFLFKRARHIKRSRVIHVQSLQDAEATVTVLVRGAGVQGDPQTLTMPATSLGHSVYKKARIKVDGRAPQVEVSTDDDVRISMLGLSAEVLRPPV